MSNLRFDSTVRVALVVKGSVEGSVQDLAYIRAFSSKADITVFSFDSENASRTKCNRINIRGLGIMDLAGALSRYDIVILLYGASALPLWTALKVRGVRPYVEFRTGSTSVSVLKRTLSRLAGLLIVYADSSRVVFQDVFVLMSFLGPLATGFVEKVRFYLPCGVTEEFLKKKRRATPPLRVGNRPVRLVYHGSIMGRRLAGMFRMFDESCRGNVEITFIGNSATSEQALIEHAAKELRIRLKWVSAVCREEIPALLVGYDAGVSFVEPDGPYKFQVPSKIYDYLSLGIPVISNVTIPVVHYFQGVAAVLVSDSVSVAGIWRFIEGNPETTVPQDVQIQTDRFAEFVISVASRS